MNAPETVNYLHDERFIRHAAAHCGMRATTQQKHEYIVPEAIITAMAMSEPNVTPERKLKPICLRIEALWMGEVAVGETSSDKPFEATVTKSSHRGMLTGDRVIGLASPVAQLLLVNTENAAEMRHLQETYINMSYRRLIKV